MPTRPGVSLVRRACLVAAALVLLGSAAAVPGGSSERDEASGCARLPDFYDNLPVNRRLRAAAEVGCVEAMEAAFADGARVNSVWAEQTVLLQAIRGGGWGGGGHPQAIELLLSRGGDPNREITPQKHLENPLYHALSRYGNAPDNEADIDRWRRVVEVLLDFGARLGRTWADQNDTHPLLYPVRHCDLELVRRLLESDMDLTHPETGRVPLMAGCGTPKLTRMLLDHGAEVTPGFVESFLSDADATWKAEVAHWLLDRGVEPVNFRFVWVAMRWRDYQLLERVLTLGASPDRYYPGERSTNNVPLITAAIHGRKEPARLLLEHGADPTRTWRGKTPAEWARSEGNVAIALLIEENMDANP